MLANAEGAARLATVCAEAGVTLATFSSDLVFDGAKASPYVESDPCNPLGVYGASKRSAEEAVLASGARALIVRTAAFFSPYDPHNFAAGVVRQLRAGRAFNAAGDLTISPTFVPDLANTVLDLLIDGEQGLWHVVNRGAVSWADFARMIASAMSLDERLVVPSPAEDMRWPARRPANSALTTERGMTLPPLDDAIARYAGSSPRQAENVLPSVHLQERFAAG